jgi:hypothetical protein
MVLKATKAVTVVEFSKLNVPASAATGSPPVAIGAESDHVRAALEQPEARPLRLPPAPGWHDRGCNMWM